MAKAKEVTTVPETPAVVEEPVVEKEVFGTIVSNLPYEVGIEIDGKYVTVFPHGKIVDVKQGSFSELAKGVKFIINK